MFKLGAFDRILRFTYPFLVFAAFLLTWSTAAQVQVSRSTTLPDAGFAHFDHGGHDRSPASARSCSIEPSQASALDSSSGSSSASSCMDDAAKNAKQRKTGYFDWSFEGIFQNRRKV